MSKPKPNQWVVNVHGHAGCDHCEISLVRNNNEHGKRSYGWFGADKLLISSSEGPGRTPVLKIVWDKLINVANETARELNALEDGEG